MDVISASYTFRAPHSYNLFSRNQYENQSKRLKADIDFNKEHSPLVEEKLRLEEAAMVEVKKEQEHQQDVLRTGFHFEGFCVGRNFLLKLIKTENP